MSSTAISERYERDFARYTDPARLNKLDDRDLGVLFRATYMAALTSSNPIYVEQIGEIISKLEFHSAAQPWHYAYWHETMIKFRQFKAAEKLRLAQPQMRLPETPAYADRSSNGINWPTVLQLETDANILVRTDAVLTNVALIIVFHPECVFSQRAFAKLNTAPDLADVLQSRTLWLRPVDGTLNVGRWGEWNRTNSRTPVVVAFAEAEWSWIKDWDMPTFYVLRDGQPHTKIVGWPSDERLGELTTALRIAEILSE